MSAGWTLLDADTHTLTAEYEFRPGAKSRSFATRFSADELLIISPPVGFGEAEHEALRQHGKVTAIVAPNGFHYLGVEPMLEAFPDAKVYAPKGARARISKKRPGLELNPLEQLSSRAGRDVSVLDVPGFSIGETWVQVSSGLGPIWYVGDSCLNMAEAPGGLPGLLLKWTRSAPGLRLNGLGNLFFLKDKPAFKEWFESRLSEAPPRVFVPGHGEVCRDPQLLDELPKQVEARL